MQQGGASDGGLESRVGGEMDQQKSCSYCKQQGRAFLVKCVEQSCQRWFCNGCENAKNDAHQKQSHIITHLRISKHRQVAVFKNRNVDVAPQGADVGSPPSEELLRLCCVICEDDNVFDLAMDTVKDGRNPEKHFCRYDGIQLKKFNAKDSWVPLVNCHHPTLTCIEESIVKVPSNTERRHCRELSWKAMIDLEKSWLLVANGIILPEEGNVTINTTRETFATMEEYRDHFTGLVKLQRLMEAAHFSAIPILSNVTVVRWHAKVPIKWFDFKTKSQVHIKALKSGQLVSVIVQRQATETRHQASVDSYELSGGFVVIRVVFAERNVKAENVKGSISIEVLSHDVVYRRWLAAIGRFTESGAGATDQRIRSFILASSSGHQSSFYGQQQLVKVPGRNLNVGQEKAVRLAMTSPLSLIQGPPGTGKTHTIVALVHNILNDKKNQKSKVLCCAPSNDPTDHLALQLFQSGLRVLRINSRQRHTKSLPEDIQCLSLSYQLEKILGKKYQRKRNPQQINQTISQIIANCQVICTTCNTAAHFALEYYNFSDVIIDEATQATETDALIPITKGSKRVVLIGDEKQLGVFSKFKQMEKSNWNLSLFERLIKSETVPKIMLDTQYRMHPTICEPASTVIYGGLLKTGPGVAALRQSNLFNFIHPNPQNSAQILMIHTTRPHGMASDGSSSVNEHEANVTALCLVNLLYRKVKPEDIGVITFYNGQKTHLKETLDSHFCIPEAYLEKLTVDSVDGFQGRQKDYIILSCVRSGLAESTSVGFLANQRRMNVALTRAKKGVIIVGNRNLLEKSDTWKAILTFYPTIQLEPALFALGVSNTKQLNCKYCENLPSGKH